MVERGKSIHKWMFRGTAISGKFHITIILVSTILHVFLVVAHCPMADSFLLPLVSQLPCAIVHPALYKGTGILVRDLRCDLSRRPCLYFWNPVFFGETTAALAAPGLPVPHVAVASHSLQGLFPFREVFSLLYVRSLISMSTKNWGQES